MRNLLLAGMIACGLQSCELLEAAYESGFNDVLTDSWSSSSKKADLEEALEDEIRPVLKDLLEDALEGYGASLTEISVAVDLGSTAPTLDIRNLAVSSSSSQYCTDFDWRISPTWTPSNAKITVTGKGKISVASFNLSATLKNLSLGGNGTWQIRSGSDSATAAIDGVVLKGDLSWEASVFSGSWEERSTELGEIMVQVLVLDPILEEYGW